MAPAAANLDSVAVETLRRALFAAALALGLAGAGRAQTVTDSFMDATAPGWVLGGTNYTPTLTSGTIDPAGQGWLRLTDNGANRATYAYNDTALSSANRTVFTSFDFAHYNGTGADGVTFFLFDGSATFAPGAFGGSMGYAQKTTAGGGEVNQPGLAGGYLAISLDDFGNFSNGTEGRIGGIGSNPNSVAVRGPGNGFNGYEFVAATGDGVNPALTTQLDFPDATTRPAQTGADLRHAEILLTPTNQLTVWLRNGVDGPLTQVLQADLSGYLRPETIKFGFTAGTGGANEIHELRNLTIATLVANLWDNGAGTSTWSAAGNWAPDFTPAAGADLLFNNTFAATAQTIDVGANRTVRSLQFDAPFSYALQNGTLTFDSGGLPGFTGIVASQTNGVAAGGHTIDSAIALHQDATIRNETTAPLTLGGTIDNGGHTLTFDGSGATTVSGAISGAGALQKLQAGSLTLNAPNTYYGGTTLASGTLVVGHNAALGAGDVTLAGGTLSSVSGNSIANDIYVQGDAAITGLTTTGTVQQSGGDRTLVLDGATLSGPVTLAENNATRTLTLAVGPANATINGVIANGAGSGADGLTKTGPGTLLLNASNTYTGATTITDGRIELGQSDRISNSSNLNLAGGTLALAGHSERVGNITFADGGIDFGADSGANALLFSNAYGSPSGVLTISNWEGTDILASQTALSASVLGMVYFSGYGSGATQGSAQSVSGYGTGWRPLSPAGETTRNWISNSSKSWSTNGDWGGNNRPDGDTEVAVFGTGTQLNPQLNANGYAVRGLRFDPNAASYNVTDDTGGRTLTLGGTNTTIAFIQQKSANNQSIGIGTLALADNTVIDAIGSGRLTINSKFTGSANLVKTGTGGEVVLAGNSSAYTGSIFVDAGTLRAAHNSALGTTAGATTVAAGATLAVGGTSSLSIAEPLTLAGNGDGGNGALRNTANGNTLSGAVTLAADTRVQADSGTLTLSGGITGANRNLSVGGDGNVLISGAIATGSGGLAKDGAGTLTLSGTSANTFIGDTTVTAGTLVLGKASGNALGGNVTIGDGVGTDTLRLQANQQIADSGSVTVSGSGLFDLNGHTETIRGLEAAAPSAQVALGSGALTVDNAAANSYAGQLSGAGTLAKTGVGRLTLSGDSSAFSGTTNIAAGIVALQSNTALGTSTVSVASGANIELQGGISVANSFTIAGPGTGAIDGALENIAGANTVTGAVALAADARIQSSSGTLTLAGGITGSGQTVTFGGAGDTLVTGVIATGGGGLVKEGAGTLRLAAPGGNTFAGATVISAGTIVAAASAVFNNSAKLQIGAGAVLSLGNYAQAIGQLEGPGTLDFGVGGLGKLTLSGGTSTFGGTFTGTGEIIIGPGATLALGADFDASGINLTLAGGTLDLNGHASTFGNLRITGDSILDFGATTASSLTVNDVSFGGPELGLTIENWVEFSDEYVATHFTGATPDQFETGPSKQIHFQNYFPGDAQWRSWDHQITPTPEPATYGLTLLSMSLGAVLWRRRRRAGRASNIER